MSVARVTGSWENVSSETRKQSFGFSAHPWGGLGGARTQVVQGATAHDNVARRPRVVSRGRRFRLRRFLYFLHVFAHRVAQHGHNPAQTPHTHPNPESFVLRGNHTTQTSREWSRDQLETCVKVKINRVSAEFSITNNSITCAFFLHETLPTQGFVNSSKRPLSRKNCILPNFLNPFFG